MKKLFLLGMLAWGLHRPAAAQSLLVLAPNLPADSLTHRIKFAGVVAVPGVSAAELQARAREWVALTFQDARQVTQLDDIGRGVLIGRGYTSTWVDASAKRAGSSVPLAFTFRLEFRDGRYRYEVFDLGAPLYPQQAEAPSLNAAPGVASQQAHEVAAWQLGGTGTVAASSRQVLYQPDLSSHPRENDLAGSFGSRWPEASRVIYQTITLFLNSLRQHETTPPARW